MIQSLLLAGLRRHYTTSKAFWIRDAYMDPDVLGGAAIIMRGWLWDRSIWRFGDTGLDAIGGYGDDLPLVTAVSMETTLPALFDERLEPDASPTFFGAPIEPQTAVALVVGDTGTGHFAVSIIQEVAERSGWVPRVLSLIDHERGAADAIHEAGSQLLSVFKISEIAP